MRSFSGAVRCPREVSATDRSARVGQYSPPWPGVASGSDKAENLLLATLAKWRFLGQPSHVVFNSRALLVDEIRDRAAQTGMRDPVCGIRGCWQIAALNFMASLRAGLDPLQAMFDSPVDGAVITKFEVQEGKITDATPVAAEQRLGPGQV